MAGATDVKTLVEQAVTRLHQEVPAIAPLKTVVALELRGGRDVQHYRVELPGPKTSKEVPDDARIRLELPRALFNELAEKGGVRQWRAAFEKGQAKASGPDQILRLVLQVVEKAEERARTRRARGH